MHERPIDATFNRQRTVQNDLVTGLILETALPLILTQDANKANEPNHQFVPESADLKVLGDEVTILGKLSCPGHAVQIFSRLLRAKADGGVPPAISVDGPELPENLAKPTALPKGLPPPDRPTTGQARGREGKATTARTSGSNPPPLSARRWSRARPAGRGRIPGEMNGEPGKGGGRKGEPPAPIFLLCGETDFASPLGLSAVGGPGGDGQPGQDGADGGDGGKGFDAKMESLDRHLQDVDRRRGWGTGANGGVGGRGGQGGDGGKIIVHSLSTSPPVTIASDGGKPGSPGAGGKLGEKGLGGMGGDSTWRQMVMGPGSEIPGSPKGNDGQAGSPGETGKDAQPAQSGSASVNPRSKVPKDAGPARERQPAADAFQRARAEYLVTEPVRYELQLQSVVRTKDIVARGRNLVVAAAVGSDLADLGTKKALDDLGASLHVRVFDTTGPWPSTCGRTRSPAEKVGHSQAEAQGAQIEVRARDRLFSPRPIARGRVGKGNRSGAGGRLVLPRSRR